MVPITKSDLHTKIQIEYEFRLDVLPVFHNRPEKSAKETPDSILRMAINQLGIKGLPVRTVQHPGSALWGIAYTGALLKEFKYRFGGFPPDADALWTNVTTQVAARWPDLAESAARSRATFDYHIAVVGSRHGIPFTWPRDRSFPLGRNIWEACIPGHIWTKRRVPLWYADNAEYIQELEEKYCKANGFKIVE